MFTENQQQAITTDNSDICVAAGAGSGKTGVLVERFVRLILDSKKGALPPGQCTRVDQILVITFTEKATREMKTRIVDTLNRLEMAEERRQVETAYISTIHGFCSRLLQENPFEAGVDPQFSVLDEIQSRRLLRQSIEQSIADAYENHRTEIIELVAAAQNTRVYGESASNPLASIGASIESALGKLRGAGLSLTDIQHHHQRGAEATAAHSREPVWSFLNPLLGEIGAAVEGMQAFRLGVLGTTKIACDALEEQWQNIRQEIHSGRRDNLPVATAALEAIHKTVSRNRPRHNDVSQEISLIQLFQRVKIACDTAKDLFGIVAEREEVAGAQGHRMWGLIAAVWERYEAAKREHGALDSDDLQAEGVRLLETAPSVRHRYQRHFRHLMVDEFQDTNALQMRLIDLLHNHNELNQKGHNEGFEAGLESGDKAPNSSSNLLFVVGDVQQSIYGFRNADATLFHELERQFREEKRGEHVQLAANFRSRPEILQTVATVFRQVWREETTPFVPLTCGAEFDSKSTPSLEILITQDLKHWDYRAIEPRALAARIKQLVTEQELTITSCRDKNRGEPIRFRDIAILMKQFTDVQKYEEAFAREGVPCFVVGGGRGYFARHEIRDLLNVLTVLETPLDDVALAAALRSPIVGATVETLYRLTLQAEHNAQKAADKITDKTSEKTNSSRSEGSANGGKAEGGKASEQTKPPGRTRREPLYTAIPALLKSGLLPPEEARKLTQFLEIMDDLRAKEDRLPVGHLLERLIAHTHYDARLLCRPGGRRRLANVRKLLQMANAEPILGVHEFIRRLRDLEKLSDREGDAPTEEEAADVVRILTIHGAKGLEFPVVFVADLSRRLLHSESGLFVCDAQRLALGTRLGGEPNVVYKAIERMSHDKDRKEAARLLYVAMTRAREHIVLCGNVGRSRDFNWADNLFGILGVLDAPPEPEIRTLTGGIVAQVTALTHYLSRPEHKKMAEELSSAMTGDCADALAAAILSEAPLDQFV